MSKGFLIWHLDFAMNDNLICHVIILGFYYLNLLCVLVFDMELKMASNLLLGYLLWNFDMVLNFIVWSVEHFGLLVVLVEELPKYLHMLLFWFFFTWFMVEFWMYIHGQHNRLFDNVGVEFKRVKCNFIIIIMFWIWNNREQAEIVFIYLLFFQNINVVHMFFFIEVHFFH